VGEGAAEEGLETPEIGLVGPGQLGPQLGRKLRVLARAVVEPIDELGEAGALEGAVQPDQTATHEGPGEVPLGVIDEATPTGPGGVGSLVDGLGDRVNGDPDVLADLGPDPVGVFSHVFDEPHEELFGSEVAVVGVEVLAVAAHADEAVRVAAGPSHQPLHPARAP